MAADKVKSDQITWGSEVPLLATKLRAPRLPVSLVPRERLLALLDRGLETSLLLIRAPAGYGKTTLVNQWLAAHATGNDQLMVGWISLDADDNDPIRFVRYLLAACDTLQPGSAAQAYTLLDALHQRFDAPISLRPVLTTLLNDLARLPHPALLVLEDYHVIDELLIHDAVAFLIEHLPITTRLLLISRNEPPLPLAQLRARGELYEIQAADLRFSHDETDAFLKSIVPFALQPDAIAQLEARTEGWAAGLRLSSLALRRHGSPEQIARQLRALGGSQQDIVAYLAAEVLAMQPQAVQDFLLQTSILRQFNAALCDAVTSRDDSAALLQELERANMFVEPLDASAEWYRYHALFSEAMRVEADRRFGKERMRTYFEYASAWYDAHGMPQDAIDAALQARTFERAATMMESHVTPQMVFELHEPHTLRRWIDQLPADVIEAHPLLCFGYAVVVLRTTDAPVSEIVDLLDEPLRLAEEGWRREGNMLRLGDVFGLRALCAFWSGSMEQAVVWSREALAVLPQHENIWRGTALGFVGGDDLRLGRLHSARRTLAEARERSDTIHNLPALRAHTQLLGDTYAGQGELRMAAELYRQVLTIADDDPYDRGRTRLTLAELAYEWNDLQSAREGATAGLDIAMQIEEEGLLVDATLLLARVEQAAGAADAAYRFLTPLLAQLQPTRSPHEYRKVLLWQARLQHAAGDLRAADRWHVLHSQYGATLDLEDREQERLFKARWLFRQGNMPAAHMLLDQIIIQAQTDGRIRNVLQAQVLKALAYSADNQHDRSIQTLSTVLTGAQADGYHRLFLDEGESMAVLLRSALPTLRESALRDYVRELLQAFREERALHEPSLALTPQEQRVLALLAAGHSNLALADELVVSVNTVKTQLKSIYRKLNVSSRVEAIAAARRLNLI